jgi:energy-converting hydrogenase Eha subunit H
LEATDCRCAADLEQLEKGWWHKAEEHGTERQRQGDGLAASLRWRLQGGDPAGQRRGEHTVDVAAGEQPAGQHHDRPPLSTAAFSSSHFAAKPPLGGSPISDSPPRPNANTVTGIARPMREARAPLALWTLLQGLWAALNIVFLGGDLFNLYVALELLTFAAVPLVCLDGRPETLAAALRYLLFALFGSVFYLLGAALLYGAYGTLDIVLLAARIHAEPTVWAAAGLMTAGLLAKTALFPLHLWLPPAHANAPAAASAVLSALVVKASFFLIVRVWFNVLPSPPNEIACAILAVLGPAAILFGSVPALRQERLKLLIAYSTVAQIGYLFLMFPLAAGRRPEIGPREKPGGRDHQRRCHEHGGGESIGSQGDAERRYKAADNIDQRLARAPEKNRDGGSGADPCRHEGEGNAFRMTATKHERQQYTGNRQDDRQHEQEPARRRCEGIDRHRHSVSFPLPGGLVHASDRSVTRPVSSKSRSTKAIASALAAKATTMPVITIDCGTGSAGNPAPAPLRAMMPNSKKTPLPIRLKARILRSGWGLVMRP